MKNNNIADQPKKNQPVPKKSGNQRFPQEYEEQRNKNIRMEPQPLSKEQEKMSSESTQKGRS